MSRPLPRSPRSCRLLITRLKDRFIFLSNAQVLYWRLLRELLERSPRWYQSPKINNTNHSFLLPERRASQSSKFERAKRKSQYSDYPITSFTNYSSTRTSRYCNRGHIQCDQGQFVFFFTNQNVFCTKNVNNSNETNWLTKIMFAHMTCRS